jgi:hypothetical protein
VTVVGLHMRVSDRERARGQWEGILHGTCEERDGGLVCRWHHSPMVLRIDVDPSREEGPIAIELATSRALTLPRGPVPDLGTTFRLIQP